MDRTTYTFGENVFRNYHWRGFRYRSDVIDTNYMRRWTIETPLGQIRLHHILRSDNDRHYHDHPFDFVSLILSGGYIEHRPNQPQRLYLPKSVLVRKAKDLHYLKLLGRDAWTLVFATNRKRAWGFAN